MNPTLPRPTLGVVIRFKNSAATLPAVLTALRRQTLQPDLILGVNNQSADASPEILRRAGAKIIAWTQPYSHPRVLNFALRHCPTDLVLVLSSHTALQSPDAVEKLVAALHDPRTACASGKWDDDPAIRMPLIGGSCRPKALSSAPSTPTAWASCAARCGNKFRSANPSRPWKTAAGPWNRQNEAIFAGGSSLTSTTNATAKIASSSLPP